MACGAIAFQIYATLLLLYVSDTYSLVLYIVDLGAIWSSKLSLLLHPPLFLSTPTTLNLLDLPSFLSPAPSCVLHPIQLLGDLVLTVYCPPLRFTRTRRRTSSLWRQLSQRPRAVTIPLITNTTHFHGTSILVVTLVHRQTTKG